MRQEIITILLLGATALFGYLDSRAKRKAKSSAASSASSSTGGPRQRSVPPIPHTGYVKQQFTHPIPIPEEGMRVTIDATPLADTATARHVSSPSVPPEVAQHRMRWRKALIDSEILKTKF